MKKAIKDHRTDFIALIVLLVFGIGTTIFILSQQQAPYPSWLPILGDPVYGAHAPRAAAPPAPRQMLHAQLLAFVHPLSGARVHAEAALPADFRGVLAALRRAQRSRGRGAT